MSYLAKLSVALILIGLTNTAFAETKGNNAYVSLVYGGKAPLISQPPSSGSISISGSANLLLTGGNVSIHPEAATITGGIVISSPTPSYDIGSGGSLIAYSEQGIVDAASEKSLLITLVPEPSSYVLLTLGLLMLAYRSRRFNS